MHDHIVSLGREVSTLKTNLIPSLVMQVPVPNLESAQSRIGVLSVSILAFSRILIFDFEIVPTVWYSLFNYFFFMNTLVSQKVQYLCNGNLCISLL
jgi:hypothetical protein